MNRSVWAIALFVAVAVQSSGATVQAQAVDPTGVYGWVYRVVPEPGVNNPERIQIWGFFTVAAPGNNDNYQAPERGYLYFSLPPSGVDAALTEWQALRGRPTQRGLWAFARRGAGIRVRTSDETPAQPDTYLPGGEVRQVRYDASEGARMMGSISHEGPAISYALLERVVFEPSESAPERIQIWGAFALLGPRNVPYEASTIGFQPPQRGYLYLSLPASTSVRNTREILAQWNTLKTLAGTSNLAALNLYQSARVRPANETPQSPDEYSLLEFVVRRTDSPYRPIRSLLDNR